MGHLVDDLKVERDGLLAEDHLSGLSSGHDLPGVLVGGGADHDGLHIRVVDELTRTAAKKNQSENNYRKNRRRGRDIYITVSYTRTK